MANIEKREYVGRGGKKRTYWRVRYLDPSGQRRSHTFDRKVDAERFLLTNEAAKLQGAWVDPALGQRPFADVARAVGGAGLGKAPFREARAFDRRGELPLPRRHLPHGGE